MIRNYNFHYNEGQGNVLGWAVSFNTFFNKRLCSLLRKKEEEEKEKKTLCDMTDPTLALSRCKYILDQKQH